MTAFERAEKIVARLVELGVLWNETDLGELRWMICEEITDALIEQVEHARAQAPSVHIHTG